MARTVLPKGNRFHVRGTSKYLFIPRSAAGRVAPGVDIPTGPLTLTQALLDEASTVDLTNQVVPPVAGFSIEQADTPAPDAGSLKTGTVEGEATFGASSMTFYLLTDASDIRAVLHTGDEGYVVVADTGIEAGKLVDIAEVTVKFGMKQRDDLGRIQIPFTIADIQENVAIPA